MTIAWWICTLFLLIFTQIPSRNIGAVGLTLLLFTDAENKSTNIMSLHADQLSPVIAFSHLGNQNPSGLDFDPVEERIYWTDIAQGRILSALINATSVKVLFRCNVKTPEGLAVDYIGRKIYWTDTGTDRIEVGTLDGKGRKLLIKDELDEPRAIVLDARNSIMYWTDWGANPKIEQAGMDGSARRAIITANLGYPNGLTIDRTTNRLYWVDAKLDKIEVSDLEGGKRHLVMSSAANIHPYGLVVFQNVLYWTDWTNKSISRFNLSSGRRDMILTGLQQPMDIHVLDPSLIFSGTHACSHYNGFCSGFCLLKPGGYKCACPTGMPDKAICDYGIFHKKSSEKFLIFAEGDTGEIYKVPLAVPGTPCSPLDIKRNISRPVAVDFDPAEGKIYWTDVTLKIVAKAFLNGSSVEVIAQNGVKTPAGLAVDYVGRTIFWTDEGVNKIEMARLNGSFRRSLITSNIEKPRAIILDIAERKMYWGGRGSSAKIEQANMDGSNRKVLVSSGFVWVNSLALDNENRLLYWCDAFLDKIERVDLQGNNRKVLQDLSMTNLHPFGLALSGDVLYWSDWKTKSVHQYNMKTNLHEVVVRGMGQPMELHIYDHTVHVNSCPQLTAPVNGSMQLCSNLPGQICQFSCEKGYNLAGSATRKCNGNGTWTGTQTQCNAIRCPKLMAPTNGSMQQCSNFLGQTCQFSCDKGYNLTGSATRRCNSNGTWNGTQTQCNVSHCPQLMVPANGSMQQCSNLLGQTCQFSCDNGYKLTGSATRRCNSNGTWTGTQTQCNVILNKFINHTSHGESKIFNKDYITSRKAYIPLLALAVSLVSVTGIGVTTYCVRRYRAGGKQNQAAVHNVVMFQNQAYIPDDTNQQGNSRGPAGGSRRDTIPSICVIPEGSALPAGISGDEEHDSQNQGDQSTASDSPSGDSLNCKHCFGKDGEPVTEKQCFDISPHVGVYWKYVLRKLCMDEMTIRNLDEDYKNCKVVEKCYQGLLVWKQSVGPDKATTKKLCDALRLVGCLQALEANLWNEDTTNNRDC